MAKNAEQKDPESGLAAEQLSVKEIVRALKRLPYDRSRVRALNTAIAFLQDRSLAKVTIQVAPWRDDIKTSETL